MAKRMLNNPIQGGNVIYLTPPELEAKLKELSEELAKEKSKPASEIIKEIIKTETKDDPWLLEQYNKTLKELGDLKQKQKEPLHTTSIKEVVKEVEVRVNKVPLKLAIAIFAGGICFILLGRLIVLRLMLLILAN